MGFSAWADNPSSADSQVGATGAQRATSMVNSETIADEWPPSPQVVALIRAAGGVPIAKTNLSQTMFFFECSNPVWGRTLNPYSKSYSCGGSSGGEGALLAMDGAALGWGSDIGGSLRSVTSGFPSRSRMLSFALCARAGYRRRRAGSTPSSPAGLESAWRACKVCSHAGHRLFPLSPGSGPSHSGPVPSLIH